MSALPTEPEGSWCWPKKRRACSNHNFIGTEHILLGLIHEGEGVAAKALESLGISLEAVREKVEERSGPRRLVHDRVTPLYPPGQEGARAVPA